MASQQKLKFCANLSMMYAKEASSLLDRYTMARKFGFKGVECAFPYEFSKEDLKRAKTDQIDQVLINVDPGSSLGFAALVGQEENFMKSLEKSIEYCMALNCKRLHIMSGRIGDETKGSIGVLKTNLMRAIPLLEKSGIVGLIEPINPYWVPNYFLNDFEAHDIITE